jgi:predicted Ser/Thr protein kinase
MQDAAPLLTSRYEIGPLLGEGGMGRVFKARDLDLDRTVALKFLRGDAPVSEQRFLAEARAQARVVHDNVCRVYELGRGPSGAFIAMQYVEGKTAQALARELTLRERVSIVRAVADAVQAAHDLGLLHRDLKPANVLVERRGSELHPYVTDFGLARDLAMPGSTERGGILGSPLYMAPEQATGDLPALSVRTDVYGLGGILYEMLAGRPPFLSATSLQALYRTLNEDPIEPRKLDARIPRELQWIALQCLEKNPKRRYASAREVEQDLGRYLEGREVRARPAGPLRRCGKFLARHRIGAALAAAAVMLAGAVLATRIGAVRRERRLSVISQRFADELREIESTLQTSALLPAHDVRPERRSAQEKLERLRQEMTAEGPLAETAGQLALGHGYLALHDYLRAQAALELALRDNPASPQDHAALGLAMGARYAQELQRAARMGGAERSRAKAQELEKTLRAPALQHLRSAGTSGSQAYVAGLIALYETRYDDALVKAREAFAANPAAYEARKLEGDVFAARGRELLRSGRRQQAGDDFNQASAAFEAAAQIGRSDPTIREAQCQLRLEVVDAVQSATADPRAANAAAALACKAVLALDSESVVAWNGLAFLHHTLADWLIRAGLDPQERLRDSTAAAEAVLRFEPDNLEALVHLAAAISEEGVAAEARFEDPRPYYRRAASIMSQRVLVLDARSPDGFVRLGISLMSVAFYEAEHGQDPEGSIAQGEKALLRSIELRPEGFLGWLTLSRLQRVQARWLVAHGQDASAPIAGQEASARQALEANAEVAVVSGWLVCQAWLTRAGQAVAAGGDPVAAFDAAADACRKERPAPILQRVEAWIRTLQAAALAGRGQEPRAARAEALIAASDGPAVTAETRYLRGRLALAERRTGRAQELAKSLLQESPRWPLSHMLAARTALLLDQPRAGILAVDRALSLHADWPEALALKAALEERLAAKTDDSLLAQRAAADLAKAKALNPRVALTFLE